MASKIKQRPKILLDMPDIRQSSFNPTPYVGREAISESGKRGTIKTIDSGRESVRLRFADGDESQYRYTDLKLIPVTKEELSGLLESFESETEDLRNKLKYMEDNGKDVFPDREYEAVKLLNKLKNEQSEDEQIKMLLNNGGF